MNFFNDKNKNLRWHNKNYYYGTTVFLIGFIIFSFYVLDIYFWDILQKDQTWNVIFMSFSHSNIWHLIGNMISLFVVSMFLERYYGSLKYLAMFAFAVLIGNRAVFYFSGSMYWTGESGTNYFLFAVFFVTLIFNAKNCLLSGVKSIFNYGCLFLVLLLMCWNGNTSSMETFADFFVFGCFSDLRRNTGHWSAFIAGLCTSFVCGVAVIIFRVFSKKRKNN